MLKIKHGLIQGYYKVDSSTDLYHQLINISQLKEKPSWMAANEEDDDQYSRISSRGAWNTVWLA